MLEIFLVLSVLFGKKFKLHLIIFGFGFGFIKNSY